MKRSASPTDVAEDSIDLCNSAPIRGRTNTESHWRNLKLPLLWGLGHEEGCTVDQACSRVARTTNPFYAPETGAFIRELERRLKEQTAVLDAYKPARKAA